MPVNRAQHVVRAKAPLRVSFCGGGTDVPPYPEMRGGLVLCSTIDRYAYATLIPRLDDEISIESLDYSTVTHGNVDEPLAYDGKLDLAKAVVNRFHSQPRGMKLFLHSDAPPGSGLGSSSALVVALVAALGSYQDVSLSRHELARLAWEVERLDMAIEGGLQDQYASAFGGFNLLTFTAEGVGVEPLDLRPEVMNELAYRLILVYTGKTRMSGSIIAQQVEGYRAEAPEVLAALDEMKQITLQMKEMLVHGRLDEFGDLLDSAWQSKQRLASGISTPEIDELYAAARKAGALGGKITGAGGGGHLLLFCQFDKRHRIRDAVERTGASVEGFSFEPRGVQTWTVE
ncbi:MAG TPA: GHMP kinase [Chloroflexota bacterium]|nr:GHMP kinase [Chloroflexota bacterium]